MKVNISELKARLSRYLDAVRGGETVIVLDRKTPIARITPLAQTDDFHVREATRPPRDLRRVKPVTTRRTIDLDRVLEESRGDR